jgi:hypothetical protein
MVRVIDVSITFTQDSTECPYLIRVKDVSITITQVSTQCPYPIVKVIDISITVTQVSTQCHFTSMTYWVGSLCIDLSECNPYVYDSY